MKNSICPIYATVVFEEFDESKRIHCADTQNGLKKKKILRGIIIPEWNNEDYISLTDIAVGFDGSSGLIEKWIRNKNTIEFLAVWEQLNNPDFNSPEFEGIRSDAGTNRFMVSAKQWIERTKKYLSTPMKQIYST